MKSTLSAEAYGVCDGAEAVEWLAMLVAEIRQPRLNVYSLENSTLCPRAAWFTDSDSLYKLLVKDCGKPTDRRVRIVVAQLKQMLMSDLMMFYWIDTLVNLADPMTKEGLDTSLIRMAMMENKYSPEPTTEALEWKEKLRAARANRKALKKETDDTGAQD